MLFDFADAALLAIPLSLTAMVFMWVALGRQRWGLRVSTGLLLLAALWEFLLQNSDGGGAFKTAVTLTQIAVAAGVLLGCFLLEWLDIRFTNVFDPGFFSQRSNAEFNLIDMLCCTFSIAVVMAVSGRHALRELYLLAALFSFLQGILLGAAALALIWMVISTSPVGIRGVVLLTTGLILWWGCRSAPFVLSWPVRLILICYAAYVTVFACLLRYCGCRYVIPPPVSSPPR